MKKFLLFFGLALFSVYNLANAQCTVSNVVIKINSVDSTDPNNAIYNVDAYFDLQNNSGNKWVFIHVWKLADYPNGFFPANSSSTINPPKNPVGSGNLQNSILDIGFNNDVATTGYLSYIQDGNYLPDAAVDLTQGVGNVTLETGAAAGYQRYKFTGITVATGQSASSPLVLKANLWSSQAAQLAKAHCWTGELQLSFYDPRAIGQISCGSGSTPNTVSFVLRTLSDVALGGTWKIYVDNNGDGFDVSDYTGAQSTPDAQGTFSGLTSALPQVFSGISYTGNTDPNIKLRPVYIVLDVTSPVGILTNSLVYGVANTCSTLPVKMRSFNVAKKNDRVSLTWETEQENNNDGFEIQRRSANGQFEVIGYVRTKVAGGTGSGAYYSFDDVAKLPNGVIYYRLRQVDVDGRAVYSDIRIVKNNSDKSILSVYPNPSRGAATVSLSDNMGTIDATLEDFTGKQVQRWNSIQAKSFQMSNLKPGIYVLRVNVKQTGEQLVERIVVQ
ncbi:MAG: T9SS type A sorting domain-containing protein [Chitinophagaceae bacterium]